jgi:hypothetical protein
LPISGAEHFAVFDQTHEDGHLARLEEPPRSAIQS